MSSSDQENAKNLAHKAIEFDTNGQWDVAIFYYLEASRALSDYKQKSNSNNPNIEKMIVDYVNRAEKLKHNLNQLIQSRSVGNAGRINNQNQQTNFKTQFQKDVDKCRCMLNEAVDEDEEGNTAEAFNLYTSAVEFFLKLKQQQKSAPKQRKDDEEQFAKLERNIQEALKRAETINPNKNTQLVGKRSPSLSPSSSNSDAFLPDRSNNNRSVSSGMSQMSLNPTSGAGESFTKDEISVLRNGSYINGREYVPFFDDKDQRERFFFNVPFTDKLGKLALSPSQKQRFAKWARPDEIFENPKLMMLISSFSVKQTCISDCSFVASLTVCAQYERKFNKRILSKIIYPKNKQNEPIYNPCGKYMISLNLNGCQRKIVIDDYLPVDNHDELLCSKTTNTGELWVSLLEKAYMKVMGGYDFPGSNSNIDLHALTSWIPERLGIHGEHTDFNPTVDFERMFLHLHQGNALITVSTGFMSKNDEDRTGLVSTHAYAVLDIRKFKNIRLFQIKNPWSHLRWRGNYSEYDVTNWTDELKSSLDYDPKMACNVDNGIFWIDYDSLLKFFDVFYLSWNPNLFPYTSCYHRKWSINEGPAKDRYNLGDNPQYVIKVKPNSKNRCTTWLLLTRHITDKADFAENKEYIAVVVYKNNGRRVYYPMEPAPFKEGVRINSPHYLVKLEESSNEPITYTLVVCQYEKRKTTFYTLRIYSETQFQMSEIKEPYNLNYSKNITDFWKASTAGGCSNNRDSYKNNPLYQVLLSNEHENNCLKIELKGPQQYSVGFDVICEKSNVSNGKNNFKQRSTGDYRQGYCILTLDNIPGGVYHIRPSTYLPGQEGPFKLEIECTHPVQISRIN